MFFGSGVKVQLQSAGILPNNGTVYMDFCISVAGFPLTLWSSWTDVIVVMLQVGRMTGWLSRQLRDNGLEWSQVRTCIWRRA